MARKRIHDFGKYGKFKSDVPIEVINHNTSIVLDAKNFTTVISKPDHGWMHIWWIRFYRALIISGFKKIKPA